MPAACGTCVPIGLEWEMMPSLRDAQCDGLGEQAQEHVLRREPGDEDDGEVAVVREPDVAAALERVRRADLAALVTGDGNDERRLALSIEPERRLVAQPSRQHVAMHREEVVAAEPEVFV
jgi:hypothetical protein